MSISKKKIINKMKPVTATLISSLLVISPAFGSSHREAPSITENPKVDATDFYMFTSYETGRSDFVTFIANYAPLQDPYGGPNYFTMDPNAAYDIHIDNTGDAKEDLTFRFKFRTTLKNIALPIGGKNVPIPLVIAGTVGAGNSASQNVLESYTVTMLKGSAKKGKRISNAANGEQSFAKPIDNIGNKTIADYPGYANNFIYSIQVPGCGTAGRMFVGQRKDPFVVNLGETFDLINIANPVGSPTAESDDLSDKNVTSLVLELPKSCIVKSGQTTIGAWTTSSLPKNTELKEKSIGFNGAEKTSGDLIQVSRLSHPLVNEVVIGLKDKDKFNASEPAKDTQFADYVTNPTLPAIIELLYGSAGVVAPKVFPRADLVAVFLTGVDGLNKFGSKPAEMMRLNTTIAPVIKGSQKNLGVIDGDTAGYPNGRRPGDDVVDISLRVVMGKLLSATDAPSGALPFTDGATVSDANFDSAFPYLKAPLAGSPQS